MSSFFICGLRVTVTSDGETVVDAADEGNTEAIVHSSRGQGTEGNSFRTVEPWSS